MAVESGTGPSQLTTDKYIIFNGKSYSVEEFIELIQSGNRYKFDNKYHDNLSPDSPLEFKKDFALSALSAIPQYNALGVSNSLLARGINAGLGGGFTSLSPLEQIGTAMLGKQMFYNSVAHLTQKNLPSINIVGSILDGQDLFQFPVDYSITNLASENWVDKLISGAFYKTNVVGDANPFINNEPKDFNVNNKDNNTQSFYIENTGKGQLQRFYKSINLNLYKGISNVNGDEGNTQDELTLIKYSEIKGVKVPLEYQDIVIQRKIFFNFNNKVLNPYLLGVNKYFTEDSVDDGNVNMKRSFLRGNEEQYAPTIGYINDNFGITNIKETTLVPDDYIKNRDVDNVNSKLVWGRDGTTSKTGQNLISLRDEISNEIVDTTEITTSDLSLNFNIKRGLLEYTRNLLNSSSGFLVDITRKVYRDFDEKGNEKIAGFNGSPVWEKSRKYNNTYADANFPDINEGIRQHNAVDKYDRYVKAIRFDGNSVYNKEGGNKDSVIYNSVMPKIHPIRNKKEIDNKNMMFSIENLAVLAVKDTQKNIGIINDEYGSQIPISEVGPFNGRIMWFPPYDLQLNESAIAKYDSISMVGRNEPIYTYMNSERTANLTFTLLVDYPQNLINYMGEDDYKKEIAKFFAFGGDNVLEDDNIGNIEADIKKIEDELKELKQTNNKNQEIPDFKPTNITFYFANALPRENGDGVVSDVFDYMYKEQYEVISGLPSKIDGTGSGGINKDVYFMFGLSSITPNTYSLTVPAGFSQYTAIGETNPEPINTPCTLNVALKKFENQQIRDRYKIKIEASASALDTPTKNKELSQRRIDAVKNLITRRLTAMFPSDSNFINDIIWDENAKGEISGVGESSNEIDNPDVKEVRSATITFAPNGTSVPSTENVVDNQENITELEKKLANLYSALNKAKNKVDNVFEERTKDSKAIFDTFESIKTNHYQPAYHSQTPEDFHRRLTFLQQCTRQGSAKRFDMVEENGQLRAKNSVFGRQPICILRVGDFFYTKVIIESVTVDYNDTTWDMNPEGFGMQPMIAKVTLQMKVLGGQSLSGPIDALQNAVSFNYYANSTFTNKGMYSRPSQVANDQSTYMEGVLAESRASLEKAVAERNKKENTQ